jgi:6-pyruvoyltetrahydropterin/6-carboxytetrahydropterin synthase
MNHESKCATLHGHNGVLWIHATPVQGLDSLGRVVDFSVLKEKVGQWVDQYWDHTMILYQEDKKTIDLVRQAPQFKELFILPKNPTAENLADYLLRVVCPQVLKGLQIIVYKVTLWETENCLAEVSLDPHAPEIRKLYGHNSSSSI